MTRIATACLLGFLCLAAVSCSSTPLQDPAEVVVTEPRDDMRKVILAAMQPRGWRMIDEEPGRIRARVDPRKHSLTVDIHYTDTSVAIAYVDSTNLKYDPNADPPTIHKAYHKWTNTLMDDIRRQLLYIDPDAQG